MKTFENTYSNPINMIIGWLLSNDLLVSAADDHLRPRHKLGKFTFWGSIDKGVRADSLVP